MTRSKEKITNIQNIIICPFYYKDLIKYLESLKFQDEKYLSYHYSINKEGEILNLIPESEVSYPTNNIDFNFTCISVAVYLNNKKARINNKEEESLIYLIKILCNKYKLNVNKNVIIGNDIFNTREFEYYIDNKIEIDNIKQNIKKLLL